MTLHFIIPENPFFAIAALFLVGTAIISIVRWALDLLP